MLATAETNRYGRGPSSVVITVIEAAAKNRLNVENVGLTGEKPEL